MLKIFSLILVLAASPVLASNQNNSNNTTNSHNNTANGGTGGAGGNATASGGAGGNATQGQIQGQIGINQNETNVTVKPTIKTDIDNKNTNLNNAASFSGSKSNSNSKANSNQSQDASSSNVITVEGDTYKAAKIPVSSTFAYAPIPTSDCLGSYGAGGQSQFFGFSFGFTAAAKDCNRRNDAAQWANLGFNDVAFARMCQDKNNRKAVEGAGFLCPDSDVKEVVKRDTARNKALAEECKYPSATCQNMKRALGVK